MIEFDHLKDLRAYLAGLPRHGWIVNLVSTPAGAFFGESGSSRDITNELDYQALMALRQTSDLIVTSAKTARMERYGRSRYAPLLICSRAGNYEGIPAVWDAAAGPTDSVVHLLSPVSESASAPWVKVSESLVALHESHPRAVVEAGPKLSSQLIAAELVEELALTIVDATGDVVADCAAALRLLSCQDAELRYAAMADSTLLTRWSVG